MQASVLREPGPGHNPLSLDVLEQIGAAMRGISADEGVRCAVIRGAGGKYFAAGGDLRRLADVETESRLRSLLEREVAGLVQAVTSEELESSLREQVKTINDRMRSMAQTDRVSPTRPPR